MKSRLNSYPFVKHDFAWTRVSAKSRDVKKLANPVRWLIYVLIITACNLIEVVSWYLKNLKPYCGGVDHDHAGDTNIIPNYELDRLMLSYRITIWTYQVHMHRIPLFYFWTVMRWNMPIKSLSIFERLKSNARISIQLYFSDKDFPITYF